MSDNPFQIASSTGAEEISFAGLNDDVVGRIENILKSSDLVLFMKGNADFPQCGFSANAVAILSSYGVQFKTYDILQDMDLRQALKEYSNWPTYPQLYFKSKLIGGNDILTEMHQEGELEAVIKS
jgi:monothiol glutaredoxin